MPPSFRHEVIGGDYGSAFKLMTYRGCEDHKQETTALLGGTPLRIIHKQANGALGCTQHLAGITPRQQLKPNPNLDPNLRHHHHHHYAWQSPYLSLESITPTIHNRAPYAYRTRTLMPTRPHTLTRDLAGTPSPVYLNTDTAEATSSSNTVWAVEKQSSPFDGSACSWKEPFRLRHISSGQLLAVVLDTSFSDITSPNPVGSGSGGVVESKQRGRVVLTDVADELALFRFVPQYASEDPVKLDSFFSIQHPVDINSLEEFFEGSQR
ncbi:MAG: hypothetical protein SGPRY_006055 [Prymnesium sp.]